MQTDSVVGASRPGPSMPQFSESDDFIPGEYLPNIPQVLDREHNPINPWPPQLITELAMQLDDTAVVLARHGMEDGHYQHLLTIPMFRREVAAAMKEHSENGNTYRRKARIQAETYLTVVDQIVNNSEVAASTRIDAIKYVGKMGDLEPRDKKDDANAGAQINVQINF